MAKTMPPQTSLQKLRQRLIGIENRMLGLILISIFCISGPVFAQDVDTKKTLQILQSDFPGKTEQMQRTLLRNMALLDTEQAVPFFVKVALIRKYGDEIRREALKGMIAIDSKKYRPVLELLQSDQLQEDQVVKTLQLFDGDFLNAFMSSLTFDEEKKITDMKLSGVLHYWKAKDVENFDYSTWPADAASESLVGLIQTSRRSSQKVHLIELWSHVRDEKSTKEMVKLLDQDDFNVQEALILALAKPGPNAVSALGRFLQKSKDATLRKRTIFVLRKMNTESAKVALKSYLPHATADEKKWINGNIE